jgi:hypothetical protein
MSTVVRDRGARARVREYLAVHGPVEDQAGGATAVLKDAVDYQGSAVAFIQLIAAMDREEEITREIRGKRTYQISSASVPAPAVTARTRMASPGAPLGVPADLDYDKLARALLREVARVMAPEVGGSAGLDDLVDERNRLQAERDEYAERLESARRELSAILGDYVANNPPAGRTAQEQAS